MTINSIRSAKRTTTHCWRSCEESIRMASRKRGEGGVGPVVSNAFWPPLPKSKLGTRTAKTKSPNCKKHSTKRSIQIRDRNSKRKSKAFAIRSPFSIKPLRSGRSAQSPSPRMCSIAGIQTHSNSRSPRALLKSSRPSEKSQPRLSKRILPTV